MKNEGQSHPAQNGVKSDVEATSTTAKILLIEDNPGDADLIVEWSSMDEKRPLDIHPAASLVEALQILQHELFDLILLDLGLPESVGVETFRKFQAGARGIPIIVISGEDNLDVAKACIAEGAQDFLTKNHIGSYINGIIYNSIARARIQESSESQVKVAKETCVIPFQPVQLKPGCLLGHYRIVKLIESGGLGTIYLAHEPNLDRDVSIKVLRPKYCANLSLKHSFCTEAQTLAHLRHPNIMPIHYIGYELGLVYYVMPYIKEGSIRNWIERNHAMGFDDLRWFLPQALAALNAALSHGIIHLDVKPENFLVDEHRMVLLCDFGFARSIHNAAPEEKVSIFGTLDYIAPERLYGEPVDHRADIYSLGATLFYLLTGTTLNKGASCSEVKESFAKPFPYEFLRNMSIPEDWIDFVARMTQMDPDYRFQNYVEIIEALGKLTPSDQRPERVTGMLPGVSADMDGVTRQIALDPLESPHNGQG